MSSKRRNFRLTFAAAAVLLTAACFLLVSVTGNLRGARVDLTDDGLFTMSPAAVRILQGLQVPVQVKLYITPSDKMPTQLRSLERDLTERMANFEQVSRGMIEFSVFNPQDDEAMQQALTAKGISPFQVQSVDKDEIGVKLVWSAMTIAYKDKPEEIIPRLLPASLETIEQDVIGPVFRLTRERTPRVAVFAPKKDLDPQLAMMYLQQGMQPPAPEDQFTRIGDLLEQGHYETVRTDLTEQSPMPDDVDLLVVMAMAPVNERQAWEINRALRGGTPVIMAVQAHEYGYSPAPNGGWTISGQSLDTGLEPMLAALGVTVDEEHFMDEAMETIDLPREVNLGGLRMQTREPVRLPVQIRVTEAQMLQESPIVQRIGSLFYLWGTPVTVDAGVLSSSGLAATNLIESSDRCWTADWNEGPVAGAVFQAGSHTFEGPRPLAVLLEGTFPDAWAGKDVPAWPADPEAAEAPAAGAAGPEPTPAPVEARPSRLFVVGSAKMFDNNIIAAPQNALLLLNAIDELAGNGELLSIRAKTLTQRVIRPVTDSEKLAWRLVVVFLVPALLAVFGLVRAAGRRRDAARYRESVRRAGAQP